jgi:hypothetical protein
MATWRCPHCGTPQADSTRCWVCSRSPMTCSTCRNFRHGVVARVGFCAMDRTREPLSGDEVRACWQAPAEPEAPAGLFARVEQSGADDRPHGIVETARQRLQAEGSVGTTAIAPRSSGATPAPFAPGSSAGDISAQAPVPRTYRPVTWVASVATGAASVTGVAAAGSPGSEPAAASRVRVSGSVPLPIAPPRATGRLLDAPVVAPTLRLGSRGDARSVRDAAAGVLPPPSANDEGDRVLEGGPAL